MISTGIHDFMLWLPYTTVEKNHPDSRPMPLFNELWSLMGEFGPLFLQASYVLHDIAVGFFILTNCYSVLMSNSPLTITNQCTKVGPRESDFYCLPEVLGHFHQTAAPSTSPLFTDTIASYSCKMTDNAVKFYCMYHTPPLSPASLACR